LDDIFALYARPGQAPWEQPAPEPSGDRDETQDESSGDDEAG